MADPTKVRSQRDSRKLALRKRGCGPFAMLGAIDWATGGDLRTRSVEEADKAALAIVDDSGISDDDWAVRGLSSRELERAWKVLREPGYPAPDYRRRSGVNIKGTLIPDLEAKDHGALVAVDYGVVLDGGRGVGSYRDGHWVFVFDVNRRAGTIRVYDPSRRAVVTWPIDLLSRAAERFGEDPDPKKDRHWGNGRGEVIEVWRWPTYRDLMQRARGQRDALKVELADCQAHPPMTDPQCAARLAHATDRIERAMAVLGGTDGVE